MTSRLRGKCLVTTCFSIILLTSTLSVFTQPIITSFASIRGIVGSSVVIRGSNFNSTPTNNTVFFGATKAVISAASKYEDNYEMITKTIKTAIQRAAITTPPQQHFNTATLYA